MTDPNQTPIETPLLFAGEDGLPSRFNTFRRGFKWASTVKLGDIVELRSISDDKLVTELMGLGRIVGVYAGTLAELIKHHASDNHANLENGLTGNTAEKWLVEVLEDIYGADAVSSTEQYTVVYVKRLTPEMVVNNDEDNDA